MGVRFVTLACVLAAAMSLSAQGQRAALDPAVKLQSGETPVAGECLSKEALDLNNRLHALTRPTRGVEAGQDADDPIRFNPNYLVGKWNVDGVVPESPLGPSGDMVGVDTIRHVRDCTYESTLQVKGLGPAYTVKSQIIFDRQASYMLLTEQDSRGFQILKMGVVGGDAGGYFDHHWQTPEFTYKGKRVRLQGTSFFASPENYRVRMQIAVDDGPFVAYGTLWWRREGLTAPRQP